ncbi:hypothetical protein KSX19_09415, partial [Bifidobacterium longum]|uniref:hypothetical protein n=1 Tax=Bifidobacterium longum TaxID=216816 RepID=UPI001C394E9A
MKSQNPINDYVVNLHIYIRIIATRAGKNCAKKVRRIYLHSTQSMQQHYSSKPIEQNSKSRPIGTFVVLITVARPCGS